MKAETGAALGLASEAAAAIRELEWKSLRRGLSEDSILAEGIVVTPISVRSPGNGPPRNGRAASEGRSSIWMTRMMLAGANVTPIA
jgi:hypothetical protein